MFASNKRFNALQNVVVTSNLLYNVVKYDFELICHVNEIEGGSKLYSLQRCVLFLLHEVCTTLGLYSVIIGEYLPRQSREYLPPLW